MKEKKTSSQMTPGFNRNGADAPELWSFEERGTTLLTDFCLEARQVLTAKGVNSEKEVIKAKDKYGDSVFFDDTATGSKVDREPSNLISQTLD